MSDSLQPHKPQHDRPLCPSPTPWVHQNPCPLSWWCHPITSFSVVTFSSCLQSFPASGSFPMSQFSHQVAKVSASASVLPMNIQDNFPLGLTGSISLQSEGLSRVFSNTTVQKHQFLCLAHLLSFYFSYCILRSQIFIWFFFKLCVSFLRFLVFFICFKNLPNYVLKHFMMAAGKHFQVILTSLHLTDPLFILFEICLALGIVTLKKIKNMGIQGIML